METQTLADELRSMLPVVEKTSTGIPQNTFKPHPLNEEVFQIILESIKYNARQGYGNYLFFLDSIYEQYRILKNTSRYYEASVILNRLKAPELGFDIEEENTDEGIRVKLWWSRYHTNNDCYDTIEVIPPDEIIPYLNSIKHY
jgi:hypothetical protein